jgi:nicotinate-nucleotide pyrophosphorylase
MIMLKDNHIDFAGGIAWLYPKLRRILKKNNWILDHCRG